LGEDKWYCAERDIGRLAQARMGADIGG
jgi:hypothetical protein